MRVFSYVPYVCVFRPLYFLNSKSDLVTECWNIPKTTLSQILVGGHADGCTDFVEEETEGSNGFVFCLALCKTILLVNVILFRILK